MHCFLRNPVVEQCLQDVHLSNDQEDLDTFQAMVAEFIIMTERKARVSWPVAFVELHYMDLTLLDTDGVR